MKTRYSLVFMVLACSLQIINAQQKISELHENVNLRAKGLTHKLNIANDSLLLSSDQKIYRVSLLYDASRKVIYDNDSYELNIPLFNLERGKYTILVYQESRIIVFGVTKNTSDIISIANLLEPKKNNIAALLSQYENSIDSVSIQDISKHIKTKYASYRLFRKSGDKMQSREEYRKMNLRPNGKPYK